MSESEQSKWVEIFANSIEVDVRIRCEPGASKEEQQAIAYKTLRKLVEQYEWEKEMCKVSAVARQTEGRCRRVLGNLETTTHNQPPTAPPLIGLSRFEALERRQVKKRQLELGNCKKIKEAAHKWFVGKMCSDRLAETVFGLINEEAIE